MRDSHNRTGTVGTALPLILLEYGTCCMSQVAVEPELITADRMPVRSGTATVPHYCYIPWNSMGTCCISQVAVEPELTTADRRPVNSMTAVLGTRVTNRTRLDPGHSVLNLLCYLYLF
jgi:hypothetical protein